jgi:N-acetylglutamate synthase-like GNAT family acetyltransferase
MLPNKIGGMIPEGYQVRRATVEDLAELCRLWEEADLPVADLKERFREFQVVCDQVGLFLGSVGLSLDGNQGLIHSEVFANPVHEDEYRDPLWERITSLARNHGLVRLWTQEDAPFWHQIGFKPPTAQQLQRLPPSASKSQGKWLCLSLKDEAAVQKAVEQEFAIFMMQQKEETQCIMRRARFIKYVASIVVLVIAGVILTLAGIAFFRRSRARNR